MILSASPTWTEGYSYIYFMFIPLRSTAPSPSIIIEVDLYRLILMFPIST